MVHLHGGTRFPHTESAPAATLSYTMQFSWLAPRGGRHPSSFAAYLLMGLPTMADFRPGGLRRFGASLRSQYRSCGVWLPLSFYADAWPVVGCTAAGDIGSTDCLFTCQRHYITGIGRCQPSSLPQRHVQDHHYGKARGKGQRPRAGIAARG